MGKRRRARELAIQVLFHLEFSPEDPDGTFDLICDNFRVHEGARPFARQLVTGVCDNKLDIDSRIREASENWRLERMSRLDRSILRLALFEILFMEDIPPKVSIDEAVDLGKTYGSDESGSFINGILDNIYNKFVQDAPSGTQSKAEVEEPEGPPPKPGT